MRTEIKEKLTGVYALLTLLVTLWGFVDIYVFLSGKTESQWMAWLPMFFIAVACLGFFATAFRKTFRRQFELAENPVYILLRATQDWHIKADQSAVVDSVKTMIFLQRPSREDTFDTAFGSEDVPVTEADYHSRDSRIESVKKIRDGFLRVYWTPLTGEVRPGEPYEHHCRVQLPVPPVAPSKIITIASSTYTLNVAFSLKSDLPISLARLVRGGQNQLLNDPKEIENYVRHATETNAPTPVVFNCSKIDFELRDIQPTHAYYLVVYFLL